MNEEKTVDAFSGCPVCLTDDSTSKNSRQYLLL